MYRNANTEPSRAEPLWPPSSHASPQASVMFRVTAEIGHGETLRVVGAVPALGSWCAEDGLLLAGWLAGWPGGLLAGGNAMCL